MTVVEPGKGRAIIEHDERGLRITIPATIRPLPILYLAFTFAIWLYVASHFLRFLLGRDLSISTIIFWLGFAALLVAGAYAIVTVIWSLVGREIIELDATTLKRRKQIPLLSRSREYRVADIVHMRVAPDSPVKQFMSARLAGWNYHEGAIAFDYGRETHEIGTGLDEADAKYIIGKMCKKVTSLCQ